MHGDIHALGHRASLAPARRVDERGQARQSVAAGVDAARLGQGLLADFSRTYLGEARPDFPCRGAAELRAYV